VEEEFSSTGGSMVKDPKRIIDLCLGRSRYLREKDEFYQALVLCQRGMQLATLCRPRDLQIMMLCETAWVRIYQADSTRDDFLLVEGEQLLAEADRIAKQDSCLEVMQAEIQLSYMFLHYTCCDFRKALRAADLALSIMASQASMAGMLYAIKHYVGFMRVMTGNPHGIALMHPVPPSDAEFDGIAWRREADRFQVCLEFAEAFAQPVIADTGAACGYFRQASQIAHQLHSAYQFKHPLVLTDMLQYRYSIFEGL
jgi:hypothetical protein